MWGNIFLVLSLKWLIHRCTAIPFVNRLASTNVADSFHGTESIQAHLMTSLTALLRHSQSLHTTHLTSLQSRVTSVETALSQVDAVKDQDLFVEYNRDSAVFKVPKDWCFEPCEGFYDTVFDIFNILNKNRPCWRPSRATSTSISSPKFSFKTNSADVAPNWGS